MQLILDAKLNLPRLREVMARLKADPVKVNMYYWTLPDPECGTVACIAGHTCQIHWAKTGFVPVGNWEETIKGNATLLLFTDLENPGDERVKYPDRALELRLTARYLFHTTDWPREFRERYCDATSNTRKEEAELQVEVILARIEDFIRQWQNLKLACIE